MEFLQDNYMMIVMALLAISEVLALVPAVQANSVFQLVVNVLKSFVPKKTLP